jgi:hypothetical protein
VTKLDISLGQNQTFAGTPESGDSATRRLGATGQAFAGSGGDAAPRSAVDLNARPIARHAAVQVPASSDPAQMRESGVESRPLEIGAALDVRESLRNANGAWSAVQIADYHVGVLRDRSNPLLTRASAAPDAHNKRPKGNWPPGRSANWTSGRNSCHLRFQSGSRARSIKAKAMINGIDRRASHEVLA